MATTSVTPTQLRADLFQLLDRVLETGEPLEIRRHGRILRIVAEHPGSKLSRVRPIPGYVVGDSDDLVDLHVSEWDPDRALNP